MMRASWLSATSMLLMAGTAAFFHQDPLSVKSLVSSESVEICGDDGDIWNTISSPKTALAIKSIHWQPLFHTMDEFLSDTQKLIGQENDKISSLEQAIEAKKREPLSRNLKDKEIVELVDAAVTAQEAFGDKDSAVDTKCGKPAPGRKKNPEAFEKSVLAMERVAGQFVEKRVGQKDFVHSDVGPFIQVCEDNLGFQRTGQPELDDLNSYCDELCAQFANEVQKQCAKFPLPAKKDLLRLERQLSNAKNYRQQHETKHASCMVAQQHIKEFQGYMEELAQDMSTKHKAFQKAEWALFDAEAALLKLLDSMQLQTNLVKEAGQKLEELGEDGDKIKKELASAEVSLQGSKSELTTASESLGDLLKDMDAVKTADKFADDVKQKVSFMLMGMDNFAEQCVREPVRNIGLGDAAVSGKDGFFLEKVGDSPAKQEVSAQLSAFHKYCKEVATGAFEKVKHKIDLSLLCHFQSEDDIMAEINSAVQRRRDAVVLSILKVQSWLDPYKGTTVSSTDTEREYVEMGEPQGLRRVMSLLPTGSDQSFYSKYLKKWKKDGEFLELLKKIQSAVSGLTSRIQKAQDELDQKSEEVQKAENELSVAVTALEGATSKMVQAKQNTDELSRVLEELKRAKYEAEQSLKDLQEQKELARKAWEEAQNTLVKMHGQATQSLAESRTALY